MKIKTITCHDVYNYGASLQAYALQKYLINQGHDVEIINYKPEYLNRTYNFWYVPQSSKWYTYTKNNSFFHLLYAIRYIRGNFGTWRRKAPFDKFTKNTLKCTRRFKTYQDLLANAPDSQCYIAGSDQIWNCAMQNGHDPAFYLDFGKKDAIRLSYAASLAVKSVPEDHKPFLLKQLAKFQAISVRESSGKAILDEINVNSEVVCDPVYLLSKNEWEDFAGSIPLIKKRYLLVYHLYLEHFDLEKRARELAKLYNLEIVSVNDQHEIDYATINVSNAGPIEFVNLFKFAEFVVTDSFHGTSFSIILNKNFYAYYSPKKSGISRLIDLLAAIGIPERLNSSIMNLEDIDWSTVNDRINNLVQKGKSFLNNHIR